MNIPLFHVSSPPHIHDRTSIPKINWYFVYSLIPSALAGIYFFGRNAFWVLFISTVTAVLSELVFEKIFRKRFTIHDGSACLTGLLFGLNLPAHIPLWVPAGGALVAILFLKQLFGGLGKNFLNQVMTVWVLMNLIYPNLMQNNWVPPRNGTISGIASDVSGTPLQVSKKVKQVLLTPEIFPIEKVTIATDTRSDLQDAFLNFWWGKVGGYMGATSVFFPFLGACYLIYRRFLSWKIPINIILTVALLSWILDGEDGWFTGHFLFHLSTGGLALGAFYNTLDMGSSPITRMGRRIYGVGIGFLIVFFRLYTPFPEGVGFAVFIMNLLTPILNRLTIPRPLIKISS